MPVAPATIRAPSQVATFGYPASAPVAAADILPHGFVVVQKKQQPPLHFDGTPNHLAHFLAHAWHHMKYYGTMYPDNMAQVQIIVINLEESVSDWLVSLHDKEAT